MKTIEGDLTIKNKKIAIVAARFNSFVVEHLISGAKEALLKSSFTADEEKSYVTNKVILEKIDQVLKAFD